MGCDIHVHTEVKIDGKWCHYGAPEVARCYALFTIMAGVRAEEGADAPVLPPQGLPADMSTVTKIEAGLWAEDGHTHSYFGADDIVALRDRCKAEGVKTANAWDFGRDAGDYDLSPAFGYLHGQSWPAWTDYPDDRPAGIEDIRWVFWFDN